MNDTKIEWTELTWNPWSGCQPVSSGCKYCYAEKIANTKKGTLAFPKGFEYTQRSSKKLNEPLKHKGKKIIFVNSMSDFFWKKVSDTERIKALEVMNKADHHIFQILTKRPENMINFYLKYKDLFTDNIWLGVTIENQESVYRSKILEEVNNKKFISFEPLLSNINIDLTSIDWAIVGGESGMHLYNEKTRVDRSLVDYIDKQWVPYPEKINWILNIIKNAQKSKVPVFFKQFGGAYPKSGGSSINGKEYKQLPIEFEKTNLFGTMGKE